tara:strand:- start:2142 stop:2675 length:534 start_codon:yes stop_codon:yes gene_type:complete
MALIPLLPLFHKFNRLFFENSLVINFEPIVDIRWSDNRLKTTAGFYKRRQINGVINSEIVLSKPILEPLPITDIQSTLCHEMIHAWIDRVLNINEIHGANFIDKMKKINSQQSSFKVSIRHTFPVNRKELKYMGKCINCGSIFMYRRRMKNIACKSCCNLFFNGSWNKKCLIIFENQ